jgi:phytoene dehydrogenase-like protein
VTFVQADPRLVALGSDGPALIFSAEVARTAEAIRAFSTKDAAKYADVCATFAKLGSFLAQLLEMTPPSFDAPDPGALWALLKTGRRFRALGKRDSFALLRWGPMAVADLVAEWFEADLLQAAVAARAIHGNTMGPWSAGTGAILLLQAAIDPVPGGSSVMAIGGPGAVTEAMAAAARDAGAEIRTRAEVAQILIKDGRTAGVALVDGTEIRANTVVSGADPKRTFLRLIDPIELDPGFVTRLRNYRCQGSSAKMNVALRGLPAFRGVTDEPARVLRGRVLVAPGIDYLERAFDASKYGEISASPYLEITFPSIVDPSLAPTGRHVMSVHIQYAPYALRERTWAAERATLASTVLTTLEEHAPGISSLVEHQQVLTPAGLEERYGLTGGHIHHGELALDQLFTMRPTLGWADYSTPIGGLFLCGSGTHPGYGLTGGSGQNAARKLLKVRGF